MKTKPKHPERIRLEKKYPGLSRQRYWQMRQHKLGLCGICGKPVAKMHRTCCAVHAKYASEWHLKSRGYKFRTLNSRYGKAGEAL